MSQERVNLKEGFVPPRLAGDETRGLVPPKAPAPGPDKAGGGYVPPKAPSTPPPVKKGK